MIIAGFGFRRRATVTSLGQALRGVAKGQIDGVATAKDKADTDVFRGFAAGLGLPVFAIAPQDLSVQQTPTQSQASQDARQTGSVAEAAALAAAGPGARLIAPRVISSDGQATCALAERDDK